MSEKIRLGISTCLLGESVRYDGTHKLDHYLKDTLGRFVEWVGVCPEVECGLPTPRPSMRLVGTPDNPKLLTTKTGADHTERMRAWASRRVKELEAEKLCGFVFKSDSPSSGLKNVKVYDSNGTSRYRGVGFFARAFVEHFPLLPVEEEGRLRDPELRENFIERVFVYKRWQDYVGSDGSLRGLVAFHAEHKLLLMAHSPKALTRLGRIVAGAKTMGREKLFERYLALLSEALGFVATVKKNVNALLHAMGYFKKIISADEKRELLEVIEEYRKGYLPLVVPVALMRHYVRLYREPYLMRQKYFDWHPAELMLRNHV